MELLKKITIKDVYGKIDVRELGEDVVPIMRVVGIAKKMTHGDSQYGTWTAFIGQFKARNLATNMDYVSSKCFLPQQATEIIEGQFSDGDINHIEFAFDIGVKYDGNSKIQYQYVVTPLFSPTESDPLAALEHKINE